MKVLALILCIVNIGMALLTGFMAMFAPMAMDAPGSENSTPHWVFVTLMMLSPLAFIATDLLAWIKFGKDNYAAAAKIAAFGWLPFLVAILALLSTNFWPKG